MKLSIFSLFVFLFSSQAFSESILDDLNTDSMPSKEKTEEYLGDLPKSSVQNLRFLIPVSKWGIAPYLLLKGRLLKFTKIDSLKLYEDKDKKSEPIFIFEKGLLKAKDYSCGAIHYSVYSNVNYYSCENYSCLFTRTNKPKDLANYSGLEQQLYIWPSKPSRACPEQFEVFPDLKNSSSYSIVSIKGNLNDEGRTELISGGKTRFLDTSFCKDKAHDCQVIDQQLSEFEKAWINLKTVQEKKSYETLNKLISNLLPCVEKKDLKCVRSFFPIENELREYFDAEISSPKINVDEILLSDLKECLKYENLLPFGNRSKSNGDKICIFWPQRNKIFNVTLPEANQSEAPMNVNYENN